MSEASDDTAGFQIVIYANISSVIARLGTTDFSSTPAHFTSFKSGTYLLWVDAAGYKPLRTTISVDNGQQLLVTLDMQKKSGLLSLDPDVLYDEVYVDGQKTSLQGDLELNEGFHLLRVRSFSFKDYEASVAIKDNYRTTVSVKFSPAVFSISDNGPSRKKFRPLNQGSLGTTTLSFEVSSYGKAGIKIFDPSGNLVREKDFPELSTWTQNYVWNGRDDADKPLPEGTYNYEISGVSQDGMEVPTLSGKTIIDNSSYIKFRDTNVGPPGLVLSPDVYTLAQGALQLGSHIEFSPATNQSEALLNVGAGFRFGIWNGLELFLNMQGSFTPVTNNSGVLILGGGAAYPLIPMSDDSDGKARLGLSINASGAGFLASGFTNQIDLASLGLIPGGRIGLPFQFRSGILNVLLQPEILASPWPRVISAPTGSNRLPAPRFRLLGAIHGGVYLDWDSVLIGLSGVSYTIDSLSASPFFFEPPVYVNAQAQFIVADGFVLGIDATLSFDGHRTGSTVSASLGIIQ